MARAARAGLDVGELLHAIDHTRTAIAHVHRGREDPHRWLAYWMAAWLDEHGQPLPALAVAARGVARGRA